MLTVSDSEVRTGNRTPPRNQYLLRARLSGATKIEVNSIVVPHAYSGPERVKPGRNRPGVLCWAPCSKTCAPQPAQDVPARESVRRATFTLFCRIVLRADNERSFAPAVQISLRRQRLFRANPQIDTQPAVEGM